MAMPSLSNSPWIWAHPRAGCRDSSGESNSAPREKRPVVLLCPVAPSRSKTGDLQFQRGSGSKNRPQGSEQCRQNEQRCRCCGETENSIISKSSLFAVRTVIHFDPSHFSYPQLILAEIHLREGDLHAATDALDDFLSHHPDWPQATQVRQRIIELRSAGITKTQQ